MDFNGSNVLVTGGAGFLGSHLVERLLNGDCEVIIADDFSCGRIEHIEPYEDEVELRQVDLTTEVGCRRATEGIDHIFHLAASVGGIHYIQRENVGGLTPSVLMNHHLLEAARRNGIKLFLFASSACIYRQQRDELNRFSEDQAVPANPHSTYGWAKILGEVGCRAYHDDTEMNCGMVRIFNAYGTRENLDPESSHVIPSLCRKAIEEQDGGSIELFGDGSQERAFMHAADCAEGMIRALEHKTDGEAVNLGNGKEVVSINDLAEIIIEISGKDLTIEHDTSKPTGTDKYAADTTRMEETLKWHPEVSLEDGIREVYQWAEKNLQMNKRRGQRYEL